MCTHLSTFLAYFKFSFKSAVCNVLFAKEHHDRFAAALTDKIDCPSLWHLNGLTVSTGNCPCHSGCAVNIFNKMA